MVFVSTVTNEKLKEGYDARMARKNVQITNFYQILQHIYKPVSFAHIAAISDLESRCSGPRPKLDFGVTRPRRDQDFEKRVSRHVSRYPTLFNTPRSMHRSKNAFNLFVDKKNALSPCRCASARVKFI